MIHPHKSARLKCCVIYWLAILQNRVMNVYRHLNRPSPRIRICNHFGPDTRTISNDHDGRTHIMTSTRISVRLLLRFRLYFKTSCLYHSNKKQPSVWVVNKSDRLSGPSPRSSKEILHCGRGCSMCEIRAYEQFQFGEFYERIHWIIKPVQTG